MVRLNRLKRESWVDLKEFKTINLSQSIGTKQLFKNVDFSIKDQERFGLIGVNGVGKTTFLDTLVGEMAADEGDIRKANDYTISYLKQANDLNQDRTVLETVYDGENPIMNTVRKYEEVLTLLNKDPMNDKYQRAYERVEQEMTTRDAWNANTRAKTILTQLGINELDKKVGELSGGQQKRVALAQVLIQESDLLILDEPTNHLDYEMIDWLSKYLTAYTGAILFVTHDRYFLDAVATKIIELANQTIYEYNGNYQSYVKQKAEREEVEQQQAHKNKQLYKKELAWMREGVRARGTKQQARKNRFEELKNQVKQTTSNDSIDLNLDSTRLGKKVIEIEDASYANSGHQILKNFSLIVQKQDRIGITGENGSGKTTFLNLITERLPLDSGTIDIGETVRIAYYTQQNEGLEENRRVIDYLREIAEEVRLADGTTVSVAQLLEQFMFERPKQGSYISSLSGGEKRRLYLVQLLMQRPNVLILDEPTNDLDIQTLTVLEDYIDTFNGTVITVSHDRYFLNKTVDKLLIFKGNAEIEEYFGLITDYLDDQKTMDRKKTEVKSPVSKESEKSISDKPKQKTRLTYHEKKEWETIEDKIMTLEEQLETVEEEMLTCGSDYGKLNELNDKKEELQTKLDEKLERWEYLSEFV